MRIVWQMVSFELQDRKETPFPPGIREVRGHAVGKIQGEARSGYGQGIGKTVDHGLQINEVSCEGL